MNMTTMYMVWFIWHNLKNHIDRTKGSIDHLWSWYDGPYKVCLNRGSYMSAPFVADIEDLT